MPGSNSTNNFQSHLENASLIIVPLFFALSELVHPITQDTAFKEIVSARDNSTQWIVSHLLVIVSLCFMPYLMNRIRKYINTKQVGISQVLVFITTIGLIFTVGLLMFDFMIFEMGRIGPVPEIVHLYESMEAGFYGTVFCKIGPAVFLLGLFCQVLLMLFNKENGKLPVALILAGLLIYGFVGPLVPVRNGHIIVSLGVLIMLLGFILLLQPRVKKRK